MSTPESRWCLSRAGVLLLVLAGLPGTPLQAGEPAWTSGGVSAEGRETLHKAAAEYNVQVVFSTRQGKYQAGIPFRVVGPDQKLVVAGLSEGPLLYLRLPAGAYQLRADIAGVTYTQPLQAPAAGQSRKFSFVAGSD